ncbi:putative cell surface receptor/MFS transporter (FLVCR) [Aspergillus clavatus NRRL 1]|uniref:Cell surface receptor/MFS transporter (FLVCR), putative n=1 Tax=Aspergillus clavatus (strain ATCC 1007 / CBS 513.65 / DSM 816 / NCTC 3887 / NRRL 1 / QM 1276 / 107) TaxID=344612 RepID=A1CI71_ASPCL|nr:cell surface receptor/MFS transporter (FLVCR), putative [Aspergillus clavatus NRRL 1]EAW10576.1 cell surface receptor/MFS transporter (FLVCR), putative [Aspergillus clavatus NRRL 1]
MTTNHSADQAGSQDEIVSPDGSSSEVMYKVYKRRFWGLGQLVLLNIIVSWDWLTFSSISTTASQHFGVSESAINWMSTGYLFAFCVASPVVILTLNKGGPKPAIIITSSLLLAGNWIRYAGTRARGGIFGLAMFGQILMGLAQPFCLSAPTRYSDLWFSDRGRISATAMGTLANPLGAALGQFINSFWATTPDEVPNMVLYISIMATIASIPSFFIPGAPPTPPSPSSASLKTPLRPGLTQLLQTLEFWLILIPFSIYVGFFNSISSLLNQILEPYGFSETDAGIAGGILIVVGLVSSAIISPITDRFKHYLATIRILVAIVAAAYIGLIFAPASPAGIAPAYVVCALLGAASFGLLPIVLEYLVEITYPFSPEIGSTICWTGGQLLGAVFILIQDALKASAAASPPLNMRNALIFAAVVAAVAAPFPICIGLFGRDVRRRRLEVDRGVALEDAMVAGRAAGDPELGPTSKEIGKVSPPAEAS